jgi:hypothetical protein
MTILEQSWSTEHMLPGKALSFWRDVICENLLQMGCGFSEPSHFTHRFRERFGSAPRTYRLNMAN